MLPNQGLVEKYSSKIKGKCILITGASLGGLGGAFATTVAAAGPALLILAGRNADHLQLTASDIEQKYPDVLVKRLTLELSSLSSVRTAAQELLSWDDIPAVDVLVNNAGIMAVPYQTSADGHELQFAVNHLGHFLFTNLIMEKLLAAAAPRIVVVSSGGHVLGDIRHFDIQFHGGSTYNKWAAYGQSKTANMLFAVSLAKKLGNRGLQAYSLHPGTIATKLASHLDFSEGGDIHQLQTHLGQVGSKSFDDPLELVTLEQGADMLLFASFDPSISDGNGRYLIDGRVGDPAIDDIRVWATSDTEAEWLWRQSESMVGQKFEYEAR